MVAHRLQRLARLTRGVSLVGLGVSAAVASACGKDTREKPHINAPYEPPDAAPVPPTINAPPTTASAAARDAAAAGPRDAAADGATR